MKIDPNQANPDLCHTSIGLLRDRCEQWFAARNEDAWFPDDLNPFPARKFAVPVNVVLFGSFLRRFLESGNWPAKEVRLWVLSRSARDVLCSQFHLPRTAVGIVPREELFPSAPVIPSKNEARTFVFAGRISPSKNIEMLLRTVFELQVRHGRPVRLELFGDFDNQIHPDLGRREIQDYRSHVLKVNESLPWKIAPVWHGKIAHDQWLSKKFEQPTFISLSTFICEDFGVSLAQARSAGWPAWVSDWGGHRDARGVRRIDPSWIADSHEPAGIIALKARSLADHLHRHWNKTESTDEVLENPAPDSILVDRLDRIRREFFERLGTDSHLIYREGLAAFADTLAGRRFFAAYRLAFSAPSIDRGWFVVTNDLNPDSPKGTIENCERLVHAAESEKANLRWVSARELDLADIASRLHDAEKVFVPFDLPKTTKTLGSALALLAPQAEVSFLSSPELT